MKTKLTLRKARALQNDAGMRGTLPGCACQPSPTLAAAFAIVVLLAFTSNAKAKMSKAILADADGVVISGGDSGSRSGIKIERIESEKKTAKDVAWLGISTDEACEVLASQLGLKPGEGLVVIYVEPNSPAAKAGLQKYDVLVAMGDQKLVHPHQLRKLVRLQKEGDAVKLEFYRGAKKQSATATLSKTTDRTDATDEMMRELPYQLSDAKIASAMHEHLQNNLQESLSHAGYNRQSMNTDLQRSVEQARKALHEALTRNGNLTWVIGPGATNLDALTLEGLNVGKGTTLTVKKNANSAKSIAKADESGTYVIVTNPKKRLTVHDNAGKLVFDGEIETEEQQQKVPPEIWSRAKAMLDEMGPAKDGDSEPEARWSDEPKS
jgi:membrane-associated protease RseP (regulator of RpoE activity)